MNPPDDSPKNGGQDTLSGLPSYMQSAGAAQDGKTSPENAPSQDERAIPHAGQAGATSSPPPRPAAPEDAAAKKEASAGIAVAPDGTATLPEKGLGHEGPGTLSMGWDYSGRGAPENTEETPDAFEGGDPGQEAGWDDELSLEEEEKKPTFFNTHPVLRVQQDMPPSILSRLFTLLAFMPVVVLTAILVAQTFFSLDIRSLWYSDEIRHAAAFQELLKGNWLLLHMNGVPYPDKPPLYFWFLRGIYEVLKTDGPLLFFLGTAVSALLFLFSSLTLGRMVARVDGKTVLASGIILLCGGYMMGVTHYARMDLFFAFLIVCSHIVLYHAWLRPKATALMAVGFGLAALAVLTKGPLGLALPLASSILFLCWRGTPLRLFRPDVLIGVSLGLLIVAAWLGGVYWELETLHKAGRFPVGGADYLLDEILKKQVLARAMNAFHHKEPWYYYFIGLPLMVLPWTVLALVLPWRRFLGKSMRSGIAASRRPEGEGYAFLWCMVIGAFAVLTASSSKILIYLLPALPALSIIMGRAVLQLSGVRAALFRHSTALVLLLCGVAALWVLLMLHTLLPVPEFLQQALPLASAPEAPGWHIERNPFFFLVPVGFFVGASLLWLGLGSNRPEGVLLGTALLLTALSYPIWVMMAPALDPVLSPKAQATVMKNLIAQGYIPVSFKDYGGTYTYYTGSVITETRDWSRIPAILQEKEKVVLAVKRKDWENRTDKPACFQEVHRQWLELNEHLLLACPAPAGSGEPERATQPETPPAEPAVPPPAPEEDTPASPGQEPGEATPPPADPSPVPEGTPAQETPPPAPERENAPQPEPAPETPGETAPQQPEAPAPQPEEAPVDRMESTSSPAS